MATLLFVPGTGVRLEGHTATLLRIRARLGDVDPRLRVEGAPWGDRLAVEIDATALDSVLPPAATKALLSPDDGISGQFWADLLDDPLLELQLGLSDELPQAALPVGADAAVSTVRHRLSSLRFEPNWAVGGITGRQVEEAARWVAEQVELEHATSAPSEHEAELLSSIARAITARALAVRRWELEAAPDALFVAADRERLCEAVAEAIGARIKAGASIARSVWRRAALRATRAAEQRRRRLMARAAPAVGDILFYQRRGTEIRTFVEATARALTGDVYLLGHSLGGIICMDILTVSPPPNVKGLITVGSQVPYFWLADALEHGRRDGPRPTLTPWLNIYDRNDFLSFPACGVFREPGLEDLMVASGAPFPEAHDAYWRLAEVYAAIAAFCGGRIQ